MRERETTPLPHIWTLTSFDVTQPCALRPSSTASKDSGHQVGTTKYHLLRISPLYFYNLYSRLSSLQATSTKLPSINTLLRSLRGAFRPSTTMAWHSSGATNEEMIDNLFKNGLITSSRVRDAMMKVRLLPPPPRSQG